MKDIRKQKKWNLLYPVGDSEAEACVSALVEQLAISPVTAKLLYMRGYQTQKEVLAFLHQEEAQLYSPFLLQDMEPAAERILYALKHGERIAVYGDYDVDGVTSVSLLYLYLREYNADVGYYIPCRSREGYGLSNPAMDRLKERGTQLMITVDTGITAIEEIAYAKSLGIDTVVTDHHECRPELPAACAVVNPHRLEDRYPFKELAGVGVIFKVICACEMLRCRREGQSELDGVRRLCQTYADLVALGTIADVMPVVDENRLLISFGLRLMENTRRPGLRALIDAASGKSNDAKGTSKKRKINSSFIGFGIAPRMNAAGRVSSASIAVELLLADDEATAKDLANQLCELNLARQTEENRIVEQAYQKIESTLNQETDRVIVIDDDTWKQGIIGIVSSRITERYGLPSILISFDGASDGSGREDDMGKGSGRSIKGLNLVEALADCEDLLVRFGGHELAAGLTIRRCNIDLFRNRINQYAAKQLTDEMLCTCLDADCAVEMQDLTLRLAQEITQLEPFGNANPVPNLMLCNAVLQRITPLGGGKHTKLLLEKDGISMHAIWFGMNTEQLPFEIHDIVDILFQLNVNEFQNVTSLQMIVQDMRLSVGMTESLQIQKERYQAILNGGAFTAEEEVLPTRDDLAVVYSLLLREYRTKHTYFPIRRILNLLHTSGHPIGYIKLEFLLRMMQELHLCEITETSEDCYLLDFVPDPVKTSIENSSTLRRLRTQLCKSDG